MKLIKTILIFTCMHSFLAFAKSADEGVHTTRSGQIPVNIQTC